MMLMKRIFLIIVFTLLVHVPLIGRDKTVPVFVSGTEGYKTYRIPAIIHLPNGNLLAFCEGRLKGAADFGNVDIVMKRSSDNGKSWGALQIIVDNDSLQAGNSAPVVDVTDPAYPGGRIFLFYNTGNISEGEVRKGHGLREVWYATSTDGGRSWSSAVNITAEVHRPKQPTIHAAYNFDDDWRCYANTPGHAMQFQSGKYKGRIFIAANHSTGDPQKDFGDYTSHGYYTDDHGGTFHLGGSVNIPGSNEATATELSNDRLMMNIRNQRGDIRRRIVALSNNGGQTWDTAYYDKNLPDPVCQGSILTVGKKKGNNILAFCNAADTGRRNNLTLRISYDDGTTWTRNYPIDRDAVTSNIDYTAYSDIVKLASHEIGVLYEKDDYRQIVFTAVRWR
jgi:sialidase-1